MTKDKKVSELKLGGVYTCNLSGLSVLIIEVPNVVDKETNTTELTKAGKIWLESEKKYSLIELHDGQLF